MGTADWLFLMHLIAAYLTCLILLLFIPQQQALRRHCGVYTTGYKAESHFTGQKNSQYLGFFLHVETRVQGWQHSSELASVAHPFPNV